MKVQSALIAWTPAYLIGHTKCGQIAVGPLLNDGDRDWTHGYAFTGGAAYTKWQRLTDRAAVTQLFILYNTIVARDGLDPQTVHDAFLKIGAYAAHIPRDMRGADLGPDTPVSFCDI